MRTRWPVGPTRATMRQRGVTTILLVALLPAVVLIMGLAIDSANLLLQRRALQSRADTAAVAGARQIYRRHGDTAVRAVMADAASQGLGPDSGASIDVFMPPATGPHAGRPARVQVQIRQPVSLLYMHWLGIADPTLEVSTSAGWVLRYSPCLLALAPQANQAVMVDNNGSLFLNGCALQVNSSAGNALELKNNASLSASEIKTVGGVALGNGAVITPAPMTGQPSIADPFHEQLEPSPGACLAIGLSINDTRTLQPGTYCDGIEIKGKGNVTLAPGLYILQGGGLTVAKDATLNGAGVTFFNTYSDSPKYKYGEFKVDPATWVQLSAPMDGPWMGLLMFDTRSVAPSQYTHQIGLSQTSQWSGLLYAPQSVLVLNGSNTGFANSNADYLGALAQRVTVLGRVQMNMSSDRVPLGKWHDLRWVE